LLTQLSLGGKNIILAAHGEFGGKWHPSWGRECR
jgi:hypothetical protein